MTAIWRRLFLGWLVALAVAAGGVGPALAGPYEDGVAAYGRGDYATALRLFRPLAEQGNAFAQFYLGSKYANGQGVPQDHAEAAKWYRLAAEQGNASAQNNLGLMCAKGQAVPQNQGEAVKWYRLAAEQGAAAAQLNLGFMYEKGRGVPQNHVIAHMWFNLAARQGYANATKYRDRAAGEMTPQQIAEAQKQADGWMPKTWDELKRQMPK